MMIHEPTRDMVQNAFRFLTMFDGRVLGDCVANTDSLRTSRRFPHFSNARRNHNEALARLRHRVVCRVKALDQSVAETDRPDLCQETLLNIATVHMVQP